MSSLKISLLAGCIAAIITLGVHYRIRQSQVREMGHLRAENDKLRFEANRQREALRTMPPTSPHSRPETGNISHSDAADSHRVPVGEYRDEGQGTPVAALQTMAWASDRGDVKLMEKLIFFDPEARAKTVAYFASLPADARAQWTSPETMAASLLTSASLRNPFPPAMILEKAVIEPIDSSRIRLRLPGTSRELTEYQKTPEGWKFAITEAMVDAYLSRLSGSKPGAK